MIAAIRYVERNPVRAEIVREAWQYRWSSAAYHTGKIKDAGIISSDTMLKELIHDWKKYLIMDDEKSFIDYARRESFVNRPLGNASFIKKIEIQYQLRLTRSKAGRPAKPK